MNNQCDGCQRGIPVVNGVHKDEQGFGMGCTKGRYTEDAIQYITQEGTTDLFVTAKNTPLLAEIVRETDAGYVIYFNAGGFCAWPSWMLLELGNKLAELNEEIEDEQ
jgi:hypothetical protein